jgi:YHS domain-containing protein
MSWQKLGSLFVVAFAILGYSYFGHAEERTATAQLAEGNVWTTADGTKYFTCPVMGGEGLVEEAPAFSDVNGVRYYYCCGGCHEQFRSNPSKWLKDFAVPGNVSSVDDAGKHFVDPVDSSKGIVKTKTSHFDLDGKRYYFASKKTMKRFQEDSQAIFRK